MFDIFKIGFITITFLDFIDIAIVSFLIYQLFKLLRGTIAAQIFVGLMLILFLALIADAINLKALSYLLHFITDIWVIAFIILFQPEIRRLLVILAKNPLFRVGMKGDSNNIANVITEAAFELAQYQHGALMIIIKSSGIRGFSETGEILNARLSKDLLKAIFYPRAPLHDGAVIIKNDIIEAARSTLPLSNTTIIDGESLGMRHRAGLGISEQADVLSVIVSEETGSISIAENGLLTKGLSKDALRNRLLKIYGKPLEKNWKELFGNLFKRK